MDYDDEIGIITYIHTYISSTYPHSMAPNCAPIRPKRLVSIVARFESDTG